MKTMKIDPMKWPEAKNYFDQEMLDTSKLRKYRTHYNPYGKGEREPVPQEYIDKMKNLMPKVLDHAYDALLKETGRWEDSDAADWGVEWLEETFAPVLSDLVFGFASEHGLTIPINQETRGQWLDKVIKATAYRILPESSPLGWARGEGFISERDTYITLCKDEWSKYLLLKELMRDSLEHHDFLRFYECSDNQEYYLEYAGMVPDLTKEEMDQYLVFQHENKTIVVGMD